MSKRRNFAFVIGVLILAGIISIYFYHSPQVLYGNDKESITKVIHSIDGYKDKSIEILQVKDIKNIRVVGFLVDNSPGYIQLVKNSNGNYQWENIEGNPGAGFGSFLPDLANTGQHKFMFVANGENNIAKMQVTINGQKMNHQFNVHKAYVSWMELPKSNNKSYTFKHYQFYDETGKLVKTK